MADYRIVNEGPVARAFRISGGWHEVLPGQTDDVRGTDEMSDGRIRGLRKAGVLVEPLTEAEAPKDLTPHYEAKHRGGGSYSVLAADGAEVADKLNKAEAETFNAMSADEKAAFIVARKAD